MKWDCMEKEGIKCTFNAVLIFKGCSVDNWRTITLLFEALFVLFKAPKHSSVKPSTRRISRVQHQLDPRYIASITNIHSYINNRHQNGYKPAELFQCRCTNGCYYFNSTSATSSCPEKKKATTDHRQSHTLFLTSNWWLHAVHYA